MDNLSRLISLMSFTSEKEMVMEVLKNNQATASMVSKVTGIKRKHVDTYKIRLEKEGYINTVINDACLVTGYKANYLEVITK